MTLAIQGPITRDPGPMTLAIGWPHDPGENVGRWPHVPGDRHTEGRILSFGEFSLPWLLVFVRQGPEGPGRASPSELDGTVLAGQKHPAPFAHSHRGCLVFIDTFRSPSDGPSTMRFALVSLPWYVKDRPPAALGVLGRVIENTGRHRVSLHYEFMHLLASTGAPIYDAMAEDFSGAAEIILILIYPERTDAAAALFVKKRNPALGTSAKQRLATFRTLRSLANSLIDDLVGALCRDKVECVGSSASFNQIFSTLALARALKEKSPARSRRGQGAPVLPAT